MPKRTREERLALASRKKRAFQQKAAFKARMAKSGGRRVQKGSNGVYALTRPARSLTPMFGGPFGQVFETELNYAEYFSMNPTIGGTSSTLFLANGLYDPYVALGGHQPHGFDQFNVIYENWQVLSSTIELTCFPRITATQLNAGSGTVNAQLLGGIMGIAVRDTAASLTGALTTLTDILERPNIKTKFYSSNDTSMSLVQYYSMPQFYGRTRGLDDAEITGNATADPTDKVYFHCIFGPPDGSTDLETHQFIARIKYKVRFFNPKNLVQST